MIYIGIDLGGTDIKAGIVGEDGQIIDKAITPTPVKEGHLAVVESIYTLIEELKEKNVEYAQSIEALGIGIPGVCNAEGHVYYATNLFWREVPLGDLLREKTGLPVFIENDATVAAMGEASSGATKGMKNSVFLTLGTGVGGGIIINDRVYSGNHGIGSEIGHIIVGENFYDCNCGNNGCLETFTSATALIKHTKMLLEDDKDSLILKKVNNNTELIDAKVIFDCAKEGDKIALEGVNRLVKYLSIGIGSIINMLDPEVIAIGGGVSKAGDYLIGKLEKEIPKHIWLKAMNLTKIVLARLGNDAGIVGSAMYAKSRLSE